MIDFLTITEGNGSIKHSIAPTKRQKLSKEILKLNPEEAVAFLGLTLDSITKKDYIKQLNLLDYSDNCITESGFIAGMQTGKTRGNKDIERKQNGLICSFYA